MINTLLNDKKNGQFCPFFHRLNMKKQYYVYLLECQDKTLYCGYTTDIAKRVAKHNQGKGAKYTKGRLPVRLVYKEQYNSKTEALKREYDIKHLSRKSKLALVEKGINNE